MSTIKHSRDIYFEEPMDIKGKYSKEMIDSIKYELVDDLPYNQFPTTSKLYYEAHSAACQLEKRYFPKGYKELAKIEKTMPPKQLLGDNDEKGNIRINKKLVPKQYYLEVAFHEYVEHLEILRLAKEKGTDIWGNKK